MNRTALNACVIAVAGALALGAGPQSAAALSAQSETGKHIGGVKYEDISLKRMQSTAAQAQARINRSDADKSALVAAARAKSVEQAQAVLLRNGFTAEELKGVPIKFSGNGVGGEAPAGKIKVTIKVTCCPLNIEIIINL